MYINGYNTIDLLNDNDIYNKISKVLSNKKPIMLSNINYNNNIFSYYCSLIKRTTKNQKRCYEINIINGSDDIVLTIYNDNSYTIEKVV